MKKLRNLFEQSIIPVVLIIMGASTLKQFGLL
jgi:hypothetical protein